MEMLKSYLLQKFDEIKEFYFFLRYKPFDISFKVIYIKMT